ncbi:MAG: peptidase S16 [Sedimenticola sp.]|nr:MAG: peptidase S16 [Sedimenticola sp.]
MADWDDQEIPLFPLNTVLFPGGLLPLRIFEPRYVDMISACMKGKGEFGVVLIREGEETGEAPTVHEVGTLARIIDWEMLEDGLLGISCIGTRRFRVHSSRVTRSQLTIARIELIEAPPCLPVPVEYQSLVELLQRLWEQEGAQLAELPTAFDNAAWVSARLFEFLPLPLAEKQQFLAGNDPLAALHHLAPLITVSGSA